MSIIKHIYSDKNSHQINLDNDKHEMDDPGFNNNQEAIDIFLIIVPIHLGSSDVFQRAVLFCSIKHFRFTLAHTGVSTSH